MSGKQEIYQTGGTQESNPILKIQGYVSNVCKAVLDTPLVRRISGLIDNIGLAHLNPLARRREIDEVGLKIIHDWELAQGQGRYPSYGRIPAIVGGCSLLALVSCSVLPGSEEAGEVEGKVEKEAGGGEEGVDKAKTATAEASVGASDLERSKQEMRQEARKNWKEIVDQGYSGDDFPNTTNHNEYVGLHEGEGDPFERVMSTFRDVEIIWTYSDTDPNGIPIPNSSALIAYVAFTTAGVRVPISTDRDGEPLGDIVLQVVPHGGIIYQCIARRQDGSNIIVVPISLLTGGSERYFEASLQQYLENPATRQTIASLVTDNIRSGQTVVQSAVDEATFGAYIAEKAANGDYILDFRNGSMGEQLPGAAEYLLDK